MEIKLNRNEVTKLYKAFSTFLLETEDQFFVLRDLGDMNLERHTEEQAKALRVRWSGFVHPAMLSDEELDNAAESIAARIIGQIDDQDQLKVDVSDLLEDYADMYHGRIDDLKECVKRIVKRLESFIEMEGWHTGWLISQPQDQDGKTIIQIELERDTPAKDLAEDDIQQITEQSPKTIWNSSAGVLYNVRDTAARIRDFIELLGYDGRTGLMVNITDSVKTYLDLFKDNRELMRLVMDMIVFVLRDDEMLGKCNLTYSFSNPPNQEDTTFVHLNIQPKKKEKEFTPLSKLDPIALDRTVAQVFDIAMAAYKGEEVTLGITDLIQDYIDLYQDRDDHLAESIKLIIQKMGEIDTEPHLHTFSYRIHEPIAAGGKKFVYLTVMPNQETVGSETEEVDNHDIVKMVNRAIGELDGKEATIDITDVMETYINSFRDDYTGFTSCVDQILEALREERPELDEYWIDYHTYCAKGRGDIRKLELKFRPKDPRKPNPDTPKAPTRQQCAQAEMITRELRRCYDAQHGHG